jgi:hypothetical protein
MSNIIRVGSEQRSIITNFTSLERDGMGRELANKIGELSSIDGRIKAVYEQRETEVLALENQRKTLDNEIKRLQVSVSTGVLEEQIQCDVYEVDDKDRIVVKSGFLPTDSSAIIETTRLERAVENESINYDAALPVTEIPATEEAPENI